jgi:hypothetical protein
MVNAGWFLQRGKLATQGSSFDIDDKELIQDAVPGPGLLE